MKERINAAIIGGGVTGISILNHLVSDKRFSNGISIDLYDNELMGTGRAYREDSDHLLLNIPADEMSLTADADDYVKWLEKNDYQPEKYTSRKLFGMYAREKLAELDSEHANINLVHSTVDSVAFNSFTRSFTLSSDNVQEVYDHVFLAIGQLRYSDPYNLQSITGYIQDPYPIQQTLDHIEGDTGIIGSGLSAIDCIRYLILEGKKEKVYTFSRSGEMPSVRGSAADIELKYFTREVLRDLIINDEIPLESLKALFLKEMEANDVDKNLFYRRTGDTEKDLKFDMDHSDEVGRLQYLIIALNSVFSEIFQFLSRSDKRVFLEEYHPLIDENHSPMPREVAELLLEWIAGGQLVIIDDMENCVKKDEFHITADGEIYKMDVMINATGPVKDISKDDNGIIESLRDHLLIGPNEFSGILVDRKRNVISPNTGTLKGMYALGELTKGADYLSNSVELITRNTKKLKDRFYEQIEDIYI